MSATEVSATPLLHREEQFINAWKVKGYLYLLILSKVKTNCLKQKSFM